jgi:chemotaxis protein CheD
VSLKRRDIPHHFLKPGEMYFGTEPTLVSTLLGSCVSVVMFAPRPRIGAICHGLLPHCRDSSNCRCTAACTAGFRYMTCSINMMLQRFRQVGVTCQELQVKLFGGADMFARAPSGRESRSVGRRNIEVAQQFLAAEGIRPIAADTGGGRGRKIFFYTHTGEVLLKRLNVHDAVPLKL